MRRRILLIGFFFLGTAASGCGVFALEDPPGDTDGTGTSSSGASGYGTDGLPEGPVEITHAFGMGTLQPFEEIVPCVSWTLDNEKALYVPAVTLANEGSFHHSNWFVVPETAYAGGDGWWSCGSRDFDEIEAARAGTVLFAQSTQSYLETQRFTEGAVVKIPPHSRIVADVHLLNLAPREIQTEMWLTLELLHPRDVDVVITPLRLSYYDLDIPARSESRHTGECDLATRHESVTGEPLDLKLHHVLPHFHALGNYFDLTVTGGKHDEKSIYRLEGFNADSNGKTFDPPLDLSDARGLRFTCGYDNWYDQDIGWGIGIQEMCVMLGMAETDLLFDGSVISGSRIVDVVDDIEMHEGSCVTLSYPKSSDQGPPTPEEIAAPLYVPPTDPSDDGVPPVPKCSDADPAAHPSVEPTLASLREQLFVPACTFSACHGDAAIAGLDLRSSDLHTALLEHTVLANTDLPLVAPGDPEGSYLYHLLSRCDPTDRDGDPVAHMPRNAPILLDDGIVATLRTWIEAGAIAQ